MRELGRFTVYGEFKMKSRSDEDFPGRNTFARFGSKQQFAKILSYHAIRADGPVGIEAYWHQRFEALLHKPGSVEMQRTSSHLKEKAMTPESSRLRDNPILTRFRAALDKMYGARLERVVLFGSQARGDAHPDSDYDVAVFLNGNEQTFDRWAELGRLAALRVKFLDETGAFFDAKPYPATEYRERSLLMHEIRREGIPL